MKTKVKMIRLDQSKDWVIGEVGFIDGYIRGADDVPYACVVLEKRIVMAPLYCLEVIEIE